MSLARTAAIQSDSLGLPELRENLQTSVEDILTQYRAQCSASSSTGQLVLPENGKLLPLLLNALLKSPLLLLNEHGKRELQAVMPRGDLRAWALQYMLRCSPSQFLDLLYPVLYRLDPLDGAWGVEDEATGFLAKPQYLFLTAASLDLSGVYLLSGLYGWLWLREVTRRLLLVVGTQVAPETLQSLFGVSVIATAEQAAQARLLSEGDDFCMRVNALVADLQARYGYYLQVGVGERCQVAACGAAWNHGGQSRHGNDDGGCGAERSFLLRLPHAGPF